MIGDFVIKFRKKSFDKMWADYKELMSVQGAVCSNDKSPNRSDGEIGLGSMDKLNTAGKIKLLTKIFPSQVRNLKEHKKSIRSIKDNPTQPKTIADADFFEHLESKAKEFGCDAIGYMITPNEFIFKTNAALYKNAIVLTMKMDKTAIALAPSVETLDNVMKTYADLGEISNKVAQYLRENGFAAHASPAYNGVAMYSIMGEYAGLGVRGRNGMLISPENGACQRLAVVFTSIENLPFKKENPHLWIKDYCAKCGKCVKKCPAEAIYDNPQPLEYGDQKYIDSNKCLEYFSNNYGCSVCIKECPFTTNSYEKIKIGFLKEH